MWQPEKGVGQLFQRFDELVEVCTTGFSHLYKEDVGSSIKNMMDLVTFFPNVTSAEHNEHMFAWVTSQELKAVISSMKVDKILGMDDFPIEFYAGFLEILEMDLLAVVE